MKLLHILEKVVSFITIVFTMLLESAAIIGGTYLVCYVFHYTYMHTLYSTIESLNVVDGAGKPATHFMKLIGLIALGGVATMVCVLISAPIRCWYEVTEKMLSKRFKK